MTQQGIIALYNIGKGWGFISPLGSPEATDKTFFHVSNCVPGYKPTIGDTVEFELGPPYKLGKKSQAIHLRCAPEAQKESAPSIMAGFTVAKIGGKAGL